MIYQGIFKILHFYFNEIDLFYSTVDDYFKEKLEKEFGKNQIKEKNIEENLKKLIG